MTKNSQLYAFALLMGTLMFATSFMGSIWPIIIIFLITISVIYVTRGR